MFVLLCTENVCAKFETKNLKLFLPPAFAELAPKPPPGPPELKVCDPALAAKSKEENVLKWNFPVLYNFDSPPPLNPPPKPPELKVCEPALAAEKKFLENSSTQV